MHLRSMCISAPLNCNGDLREKININLLTYPNTQLTTLKTFPPPSFLLRLRQEACQFPTASLTSPTLIGVKWTSISRSCQFIIACNPRHMHIFLNNLILKMLLRKRLRKEKRKKNFKWLIFTL
jgi:hypothetical protein